VECTIPPSTDVEVLARDVGFTFSTLAPADQSTLKLLSFSTGLLSDVVGKVASLEGRCSGYVATNFLTAAR
jgi:hypothetical protein